MAESKWHLVSTFDRTQTLDEFCTSINFTRDTNENFIYRIKGGIEQGKEMKKENWYRVTINNGDVATYNGTTWSLDSNIEKETTLLPRTSYWIFGVEGDKIKGQWGSRGTGTGVMDIKSIFLSVLPGASYNNEEFGISSVKYFQDLNAIHDVLARVEFTGQTEYDIIYFQKDSIDRMFKKFEEAFNKTKNYVTNPNGEVSFEFFRRDYYHIWDYMSDRYSYDCLKPVFRNPDNQRTTSLSNPGRSPAYTNAQDAWNGLFCFEKVSSDTNLYGRIGGWELDRTGKQDTTNFICRCVLCVPYVQYADLLAIKE